MSINLPNVLNDNIINKIYTFTDNKFLSKDISIKNYIKSNKLRLNGNDDNNINNINNDMNQIGFYIPYKDFNDKNIIEYIDDIYLEIDNIPSNNVQNESIFNFIYKLPKKINNVYYINFYRIVLPKYPFIEKKKIENDNLFINQFNAYFIDNKLIKSGNDYKYNNITFNIHNITSDKLCINFSVNNLYNNVFEIIYDNHDNIISSHLFYISKKSINDLYPYLVLSIEPINNIEINSTNDYNMFSYLTPRLNRFNNIYYWTNNCFKLFKLSNLQTISKLHIKICDNFNNPIFYNKNNKHLFDNYASNISCTCMIMKHKSGCVCTYIRSQNYIGFKIFLTTNIGVVKNDLLKNLIN